MVSDFTCSFAWVTKSFSQYRNKSPIKSTEPRVGAEAHPERAASKDPAAGRLRLAVAGGGVGGGGSDARVLREDGEGQHHLALRHRSAGKKLLAILTSHFISISSVGDFCSKKSRNKRSNLT